MTTPIGTATNLARNAAFDEELGAGAETTWNIGMGDEDKDKWAFDYSVKSTGDRSIRFEPAMSCVASQLIDTDLSQLEGKLVVVSADIRQDAAPQSPMILVMAFNDDLDPHPVYQVGLAGVAQAVAPRGRDGRFVRYTAKFTATAPAKSLQVMLLANGNGGTVWFDNVEVTITEPAQASA
jgi:hypothetical protein